MEEFNWLLSSKSSEVNGLAKISQVSVDRRMNATFWFSRSWSQLQLSRDGLFCGLIVIDHLIIFICRMML